MTVSGDGRVTFDASVLAAIPAFQRAHDAVKSFVGKLDDVKAKQLGPSSEDELSAAIEDRHKLICHQTGEVLGAIANIFNGTAGDFARAAGAWQGGETSAVDSTNRGFHGG